MAEFKLGVDEILTFDVISREEQSSMMKEVGALLNKCEGCPLQEYGNQAEFVDVEDRVNLCGACPVYQRLREHGDRLYGYDMTKRQLAILNKSVSMTGAEMEELFYSGVDKSTIARTMGYKKGDNSGFKTICRKKGAEFCKASDLTAESKDLVTVYATI